MFIVQLENNVWLADGVGDPSRTTARENAKVFNSFINAKHALVTARKYRLFLKAVIVGINNEPVCQISGMTEQQSEEISRSMVDLIQSRDYTKPFVITEA